jgi:WD40 repeat protein
MSTPRDRIEAKLGLTGPPLSHLRDDPPRIPDHELIRRIGRGAYGEVWLARNALGTLRAVKIVYRDNFKDARPYEREFAGIRRFEPLSRSNEGFVDVLQVGRDDAGGWFYYIMELADAAEPQVESSELRVEGEAKAPDKLSTLNFQPSTYTPRTLSRDLQQCGRLPLEQCLELGLTVSFALGHLHRHGLIHRDIKPSNIIFVGGVPKLADIGLVTEAEGANTFVGTEGFIPPEGPTSPQADLYALGKVLYEAAMGKDRNEFPEPFTQIGTDRESVALMELNAVLLRACKPDRRTRYASAEEMHADLAILHSGGSVKRRHRLEKQFRLVKQVGAAAIVATLLIGAAWVWQRQQTKQMTRLAAEKSELADTNARLADENRQRIVRLDVANGIRLLDEADPAAALLWFADALPLVTNQPAEAGIHRIRIEQTLNQTPRWLQVFPHKYNVSSVAFSQDGRRIVTGTVWGELRVWDVHTGESLMKPQALDVDGVGQTRFTRDGQRVFASSLRDLGFATDYVQPTNVAAIIEVGTGHRVVSLSGTNLVRADLSPDERWLVTADTDHVIRVHDARDGRPVVDLKGHTDRIVMVSFSTNGNVLASLSQDRTVRLWGLPSGEQIGSPIRVEPEWGPISLSQDGRVLATTGLKPGAGTNSIIETWDVETGARVGAPIEVGGTPGIVSFLPPEGQRLLIMSDKDNGIFDRESHARLLSPISTPPGGQSVAISPDGHRIALGSGEGLAGVWSLETGELLFPPCLRNRPVGQFEFNPDGTQLLCPGDDGTALLLSLHLPQESASYRFDGPIARGSPPQQSLLLSRRFSPDRKRLLFERAGMIRLVDLDRLTVQPIPPSEAAGGKAYAYWCFFDASGRQWAITYGLTASGGPRSVELWREAGHTTNRFVLPHPAQVSKLMFTPDGSRLITFGDDRRFRFWKTSDGSLERSLALPEELTMGTLFPDGRTAFAVHREHVFALYDLITGSITKTPMPPLEITGYAFDPSAGRFATASSEKWTRVWSTRTGEPLTPPLDHGGEVRWMDFSPDGKRLLTAGLTPEVRIWDASTGEPLLAPLRLGTKPLETAGWSLDGRFIVARSDDNVVRVWDSATGEAVTPLLKHSGYVRLASLVANNRLITLSLPNVMRAWDLTETHLTPDAIADYAKLASGRRLNAAGVTVPATPSELADLCRSLRARAPQLFE